MRRIVGWVYAALLILGIASWFRIEGPWADRAVSNLLSRRFETPVKLTRVRVIRWSRIYFGSLAVSDAGIHAGAGSLDFAGRQKTKLFVRDVLFAKDMKSRMPLPSSILNVLLSSPLSIDELRLVLVSRSAHRTVHLTRCVSKELQIKGGIRFEGRRPLKAHLVAFFPNHIFQRLPWQLGTRMIEKMEPWKGLRFIFTQDQLTVFGQRGPLLRAQWKLSS